MNIDTNIDLSKMTLGKLKEELEKVSKFVDDSATIDVSTTRGDRPWESDQHSLSISGKTKE